MGKIQFIEKRIKEALKIENKPFKTLASEIGFTEAGLYKALKNETLTIKTLEKIAQVLKRDLGYFTYEKFTEPNLLQDDLKEGLGEFSTSFQAVEAYVKRIKMIIQRNPEIVKLIEKEDRAYAKMRYSIRKKHFKDKPEWLASITEEEEYLNSLDLLEEIGIECNEYAAVASRLKEKYMIEKERNPGNKVRRKS